MAAVVRAKSHLLVLCFFVLSEKRRKKYREEKVDGIDRVRQRRAEDEKWNQGETGVSGMDTFEHGADD